MKLKLFTAPVLPKQKKRKICDKKNDNAKLEEAFQILKESIARKEIPPDSCAIYSPHVANKLRSYSNKTQIQVEHAINNILFKVNMGRYDYNYPVPNSPIHYLSDHNTTSSPLPSPTFSNSSTISSISNCPTPIPDYNMLQNNNFQNL